MAQTEAGARVLISDFDGTITRHDFYSRLVEMLLSPADLEPWHRYTAGEISHFEALRRIFGRIRADEAALDAVMQDMAIDPALGTAVGRLHAAGWEVVVVSNGCRWYIDRLLARAGVAVTVFSNPGHFDPARGLTLEPPSDSPYFDPETGISKRAVVEDRLRHGATVAFAGDGRPDVAPALQVPAERRFARGWLADHLEAEGHAFVRYEAWSEIAHQLVSRAGGVRP